MTALLKTEGLTLEEVKTTQAARNRSTTPEHAQTIQVTFKPTMTETLAHFLASSEVQYDVRTYLCKTPVSEKMEAVIQAGPELLKEAGYEEFDHVEGLYLSHTSLSAGKK